MLTNLATAKLIDLSHKTIKEFTVVTDNDGRTVKCPDSFLQHILRCHIKMVGGLVKDEQVNGFQQQTDHGQTTAFATTEHFYTLVALFTAEHKSAQYVIDA